MNCDYGGNWIFFFFLSSVNEMWKIISSWKDSSFFLLLSLLTWRVSVDKVEKQKKKKVRCWVKVEAKISPFHGLQFVHLMVKVMASYRVINYHLIRFNNYFPTSIIKPIYKIFIKTLS